MIPKYLIFAKINRRLYREYDIVTNIKIALVTGGGTGIGSGIAKVLAKAGYDVAISYCGSAQGAAQTVESIEKCGQRGFAIKADVSKIDDIHRMFNEVISHFGRLDVFVNNAGITEKSDFLSTTPELFDKICAVDYRGAFFCMQRAAKIMAESGTKGNIILISSNNTVAHFADVSVYASAKSAAAKMAEHAAIELAKYGIRVNTVAPGWTDTGASRLDAKEETYYKVPLKKWATIEEIGQAIVFLASEAASSVTGTTMIIDNGACLVSDKRERYGF